MFIAKKSCSRNDSVRYSSKKNDNEMSFVFTHRPSDSNAKNQSANTSQRNSGEKVLKLRGNSKNSGIKISSQNKTNEKSTINFKETNLESSKRNDEELLNSKKFLSSTNNLHQSIESSRKPSSSSKQNQPSLTLNWNVSYSKANK